MNEKLLELVSKRLGLAILAGYAIHEMSKVDVVNSVQYGWMITALGCAYIIGEVVSKFSPCYNKPDKSAVPETK